MLITSARLSSRTTLRSRTSLLEQIQLTCKSSTTRRKPTTQKQCPSIQEQSLTRLRQMNSLLWHHHLRLVSSDVHLRLTLLHPVDSVAVSVSGRDLSY